MLTEWPSPLPISTGGNFPSKLEFGYSEIYILPEAESSAIDFWVTLRSRKSGRNLLNCSLSDLSSVLFHSFQTRQSRIMPNRRVWLSRTCPSAGGLHPIVPIVLNPPSLNSGAWTYNPQKHQLGCIQDFAAEHVEEICNLVAQIVDEPKSTIIWLIAQTNLLDAAYKNPETLIWREAGALTMTIQCVATALRLQSRMIGATGGEQLKQVWGSGFMALGGIILGR